MEHKYQQRSGCLICSVCGTAKHPKGLDGFKYWFAGEGFKDEPPCRKIQRPDY